MPGSGASHDPHFSLSPTPAVCHYSYPRTFPYRDSLVRIFREEKGRLDEIAAEFIDEKRERELERLVLSQPAILGEELLFIGEQTTFPDMSGDAIDILALDQEGNTVIIELKRGTAPGSTDFQLLKYASYVHRLGPEDLAKKAKEFFLQEQNKWYWDKLRSELDIEEEPDKDIDLIDLLYRKFRFQKYDVYEERFNKKQRMVLLAEGFDARIGSVLLWLHRQGIDVAGYEYRRFRSGGDAFYSFDRVIPPLDIEAELEAKVRKHVGKAWLVDGRAWHHSTEENWPENITLLDALVDAVQKSVSAEVTWNQKLYIKVFGASKRELRVYPGVKKGRVDLLFMRSTTKEIDELVHRHGAINQVNPSYVYDEGTPWIGATQLEELKGPILSAINAWLAEQPQTVSRSQ